MNFIGALQGKDFKAPFMFRGNCDSKLFEVYLEKCLLPELQSGQTVIADNAAFHKSSKARELIKSAKCKLLFLPSYSPDLNPIEHEWFPIKNNIRKLLDCGNTIEDATLKTLKERSEPKC